MTSVQKIAEIEAEMARTQKNKATAVRFPLFNPRFCEFSSDLIIIIFLLVLQHHLGMLKAKVAKLKREIIEGPRGQAGTNKAGDGFDVTKSGDARVGLIGFPYVVCLFVC
jgi:ribosome-interacting GTPase 1